MKKVRITFLKTLSATWLLMLLFAGINLHAQDILLRASDDAVAWSEFPARTATEPDILNGGNILANRYEVTVDENTVTHNVVAYVKFNISQFANRTVKSANFSTRGAGKAETETQLRLRRSNTGFSRATTNWSNRPNPSGELAMKTYNTASARRAYDLVGNGLVDYINEELLKGSSEIGFAIEYKAGTLDGISWIGGKGDGTWGPELVLTLDDGIVFLATDDAAAFKETPERTAADFHASNILVTKIDDNTEAVSFVKFNLAGFAYKRISAVEFSTRGASKTDKSHTVQLRRTNTDFSRSTTNWSNKPSMSGKLATRVYTTSSARTVYTQIGSEIINYINEELAKGNETISFGLQYDSGDLDAGNWMGGKGDALWGPILKVVPDNEKFQSYAIADAVAFSNLPDQTGAQWHASNILVAEVPEEKTVISYLKFDISGFSGRVVKDVKFSTRSSMAAGKTMTVKLTQAGDNFARDTTNWSNKPGTSGELAVVVFDDNSGRKYYVPDGNKLVDYINGKLAAGAGVVSFGLMYKDGDGGDLNWIGGKGDGAWGPVLEMTFDWGFNSFASGDAMAFEHLPGQSAPVFHASNLKVEKTETTNTVSYVKFNLTDVAGLEVVDAKFSTRSSMKAGTTMTVRLRQADTGFQRDTTNWNNRPAATGELATVDYNDQSNRKYFDNVGAGLVNYINQHTLFGATEVGFALDFKAGDGGDLNWIAGKGDGAWGPQLELTFRRPLERDTIFVLVDAYVDQATPEANYGAAADMGIRKSGDGTDLETYLKFDISNAADAVIGKVNLTAYIAQHSGGTAQDNFYVDIFAVEDNTWAEMEINWNNKPAAGMKLIEENVSWFNTGQNVAWSSDALTHYINAAVKAGKEHVTLVLKGKNNTPGNRLWMAGREWKPKATALALDYTVAPPAQNLPVVADAYVSQVAGEQDTNFGAEADQHIINDDANNASKWIYFRYDLSGAYGPGISATLNVYGSVHNTNPNLAEFHFGVYPVTNIDWLETEINWTNKPAVGAQQLLTGMFAGTTGRWMGLTSAAFTDYVNQAIKDGKTYITLAAKGLNPTPGERAYISGKEWRASYITMGYEPEAALPRFAPNPGQFISSVNVAITTPTAGAQIYYTLDNTEPSQTNGTLYTGPIALSAASEIKTYNIRAIAYADGLKPSGIATATYVVTPVGLPQFTPTPLVSYQKNVLVTIAVEPAGSIIRYSDDGGTPTTLYDGPILLTQTTNLKAQAYSADFSFATSIVEATYEVVQTTPAPGVGPGGVGFADLSRENQPALSLWLRAHDLAVADGEKVLLWEDQSGNSNNAHNDETGVDTPIPNTGENWKPAPTLVADGLNGWSVVNFGSQLGGDNPNVRNLIVDDADNLDGGAGISIFLVLKRNQMFGDFAAIFQKRDIRNQPAQSSYVLEMDGGANPNKMQFVIARDVFQKSIDPFNDEDFYIVNVGLNSKHKLTTFLTDGVLKSSTLYQKPIQNSHAPMIIGGFQPVDIAEIVMFNSDVNMAQTVLINNYLAAKYQLDNVAGVFYSDPVHVHDLIGVGRAADLADSGSETHNFSAGGGLQILAGNFAADGDYVMAGHNGAVLAEGTETKAWTRFWNVETAGNGANVTLGFDFETPGISSTPSTDYKLWYKASQEAAWINMDITPVIAGNVLNFAVSDIQPGVYAIGVNAPGANAVAELTNSVNEGFQIYPNPARERVTVMVEDQFNGHIDIRVRDIYGRLVTAETVVKNGASLNHELDLTGLRTGTYMIEVVDNNKRSVRILMIQ